MQFGPLDIPDDIISALERGELVVFAGAGISCGGNSKLPLFSGLVEEIGKRSGQTLPPGRRDFDTLLGEWDELDVPVHRLASEIIGDPASKPNDAHRYLLQLFRSSEHTRIVTTNFDRHFQVAAREGGLGDFPIFRSPALPLGDDFHGIVHLHGSVDDPPRRLVITDEDFGRAYLSQGWARTFLQSMYAKFTVLFVGFSHEDMMLTYLARGLGTKGQAQKFALFPAGQGGRWKQLKVDVVPYQRDAGDDDHSNLSLGLSRWVARQRLTPHDVRLRVKEIVRSRLTPSQNLSGEGQPIARELSREDADFLKHALRGRAPFSWFVEDNYDIFWVKWLHSVGLMPSFGADLRTEADDEEGMRRLDAMHWGVRVVLSESSPMEVFRALGGELGPSAWHAAVLELLQKRETAWQSPHLTFWLHQIYLTVPHHFGRSILGSLVQDLAKRSYGGHAVRLFTRLIGVRTSWERRDRGFTAPDRPTVHIAADRHDIAYAWEALEPARTLGENLVLFDACRTSLNHYYLYSRDATGPFDPITGHRGSIQESKRADLRDEEEILCDIFVQVILDLAKGGEGVSEPEIRRWLNSSRVGWQRFGYLALQCHPRLSAKAKLAIVLDEGLAYPVSWEHQSDPDNLLAAIFPGLNVTDRKRLLASVMRGPGKPPLSETETETDAAEWVRTQRNLRLKSLARRIGREANLDAALQKAGLTVPVPQLPKDPELEDFSYVHDVHRSPISEDELLKKPVAAQLDYLLSFQGDGVSLESPNREGLLAAVSAAAENNPAWGRDLIQALIDRNELSTDIWDRLAWRMNWAKKEPEIWRWFIREVLPRFESDMWKMDRWNGFSFLLFNSGEGQEGDVLQSREWEILVEWSLRAWRFCADQPVASSHRDHLTDAINHPAGRVVEFWLRYLGWIRRNERERPYEWPERLVPVLPDISTGDVRSLLGLSILGSSLAFVRYAVPAWTRYVLLPLLDLEPPDERTIALWDSWLSYGRLSEALLNDFAVPFERHAKWFLSRGPPDGKRYLSYVAIIATHPLVRFKVSGWITAILREATPEQRGWWASEIARVVAPLPLSDRLRVWQGWARDYWVARTSGTWGKPAAREFEGFVEWPIAFNVARQDMLALLRQLPVHPLEDHDVLRELEESSILRDEPDFVAQFLRWLLGTVSVRHAEYRMEKVVPKLLLTDANVDDLEVLANRLIELGGSSGIALRDRVDAFRKAK